MNAITNIKGGGKPDGKYIDMKPIREFVKEHNLCTLKEAMDIIHKNQMPDMTFDELKTWLKNKFSN